MRLGSTHPQIGFELFCLCTSRVRCDVPPMRTFASRGQIDESVLSSFVCAPLNSDAHLEVDPISPLCTHLRVDGTGLPARADPQIGVEFFCLRIPELGCTSRLRSDFHPFAHVCEPLACETNSRRSSEHMRLGSTHCDEKSVRGLRKKRPCVHWLGLMIALVS